MNLGRKLILKNKGWYDELQFPVLGENSYKFLDHKERNAGLVNASERKVPNFAPKKSSMFFFFINVMQGM